jgi:hypothetical protein
VIGQTDQMKLWIVSGVTSNQRRLRDLLHNGGAGKVGASEVHAENADIITDHCTLQSLKPGHLDPRRSPTC